MLCIYHANCNDGSGAALAVHRKYGDVGNFYKPCQYGDDFPSFPNGEEIIIVDFSFPRDVLLKAAEKAKSILIIDHHKTAEKQLASISKDADNITAVFDMGHSGAVLAWKYFHPTIPTPDLLLHIQDRDLWRFEMPCTKAIGFGLQLYPKWKMWFDLNLTELSNEGDAIGRFLWRKRKRIIRDKPVLFRLTEDVVPVYNMPGFMISDTLSLALEEYPESRYAVAYFDIPGKRVYSLRSRKGSDVDVSEIAIRFGGGGHKHAAGFSLPLEKVYVELANS